MCGGPLSPPRPSLSAKIVARDVFCSSNCLAALRAQMRAYDVDVTLLLLENLAVLSACALSVLKALFIRHGKPPGFQQAVGL